MEKKVIDYTKLNGWAIDADPDNEPTYPIKKYTGDDHQRKNWERPSLQKITVEVLKSTERPYMTAVYGSVAPPKGVSGVIRRMAFKYSENMYRHWFPLLLADRIDVIEGIFGDIFRGRLPRLLHERGWGALWKFRPDLVLRKVMVRLLILGAIVFLIAYLCNRK